MAVVELLALVVGVEAALLAALVDDDVTDAVPVLTEVTRPVVEISDFESRVNFGI
tara:strand:+ start:607 stop:771 length:165 start_codon:yes stop_codon:yes gene_type:complete